MNNGKKRLTAGGFFVGVGSFIAGAMAVLYLVVLLGQATDTLGSCLRGPGWWTDLYLLLLVGLPPIVGLSIGIWAALKYSRSKIEYEKIRQSLNRANNREK